MWYVVEFTDTDPNELSIYAFAAHGLVNVIRGLESYSLFHDFDTVTLFDHPDGV